MSFLNLCDQLQEQNTFFTFKWTKTTLTNCPDNTKKDWTNKYFCTYRNNTLHTIASVDQLEPVLFSPSVDHRLRPHSSNDWYERALIRCWLAEMRHLFCSSHFFRAFTWIRWSQGFRFSDISGRKRGYGERSKKSITSDNLEWQNLISCLNKFA